VWSTMPGSTSISLHSMVMHFFVLNNLSGCTTVFLHSPAEGHLDVLHVLTLIDEAAVTIHVQVFVWTQVFSSFGQIPRSINAGWYAKSVCAFVRIC
jgi:hypothetical protein